MKFETGDWVEVRPFGHRGTAEVSDRDPSTILVRLEPDDPHFTNHVYSQDYELRLVCDAELEEAERKIEQEQAAIKRIDASIRFHQSERRKAAAALSEARKAKRAAAKLPRKRSDG